MIDIAPRMKTVPLGNFKVNGLVGQRLDTVLNARILSDLARNEIYPEAIRALEERLDDRLIPDTGMWRGEFWGKWTLSAIAAYQYTKNQALKDQIYAGVVALIDTQDENGYIGSYNDSAFVVNRTSNCWNVWCRKYTLWGLIEAFELFGEEAILVAAGRMMDHLMTEVGPGAVPIIETGMMQGQPSASILSPLVRLFRHTSDPQYLAYAGYIVDQWSAHPDGPPDILRKGLRGEPIHTWFPDVPRWVKAYEFVSCVEGLLDLYQITGESEFLQAVIRIQADIVANERLIIGGISDNDRMDRAPLQPETITEVCDAVYWQRLNAALLAVTGESRYADEIERTLYNCLCGAANVDGSWAVRRLALAGEHWPAPRHCGLTHHQCCVNNLPRGLLQAVEHAVMTDEEGVLVNLYLSGVVDTQFRGEHLRLRCETEYPVSGEVRLTVESSPTEPYAMKLRVPDWSEESSCTIAGESVACMTGAYTEIRRVWRPGDTIELRLDMRPRTQQFPDPSQKLVALERGPLVLARDMRLGGTIDEVVGDVSELQLVDNDGFTAVLENSDGLRFCDYASAGSTWDKATSDFRVWLPPEGSAD